MSIIDVGIFLDQKEIIKKIDQYHFDENDDKKIDWQRYIDCHKDFLMSESYSNAIIEVQGTFFCYQQATIDHNEIIFLSREAFLKLMYKKVFDYVPEGIQIFDCNGYLLDCNTASMNLEDYTIEEAQGKHLLDLYNLSEEYSTTLSVIRTEKPVLNRCDRFITKKGKELITINSGYPLKNNEKILGVGIFESDISLINNMKNRSFNLESFMNNNQSVTENIRYHFNDIIHVSDSMKEAIKTAKKLAITNANLLISGETGTGKEMFAQSIHAYSTRQSFPFIDINCSAIPSNLIESVFFGTEKGAFTGSIMKSGLFELADGGTLFLDEINSMDYEAQIKLLRVLQEKKYQRVGGNKYYHCDVRIIAATNEKVNHLIDSGRMRKDFYYRVAGMKIVIPPLRERVEDLIPLTKFFVEKICNNYERLSLNLSPDLLNFFQQYQWPGNVRELENILEYMINFTDLSSTELSLDSLPEYLLDTAVTFQHSTRIEQLSSSKNPESLKENMIRHEREYVLAALERNHWKIAQTAKELHISRQNLQYRMKKHKI
jgi:arginine utilization regulatory protein